MNPLWDLTQFPPMEKEIRPEGAKSSRSLDIPHLPVFHKRDLQLGPQRGSQAGTLLPLQT